MTRSFSLTFAPGVAAVGMLAAAPACTYQIQGKVLPGAVSTVQVVPMDSQAWDAAARAPGIGGANVEAIIDPDRAGRRPVQAARTGANGDFSIPIPDFGAGVLEYDVLVTARLPGHAPASQTFRLPTPETRFIIYLATGADRQIGEPRFDPDAEIERYWR